MAASFTAHDVKRALALIGICPLGDDLPPPADAEGDVHDPGGCLWCTFSLPCRSINQQMKEKRIRGFERDLRPIYADDVVAA